METLAKLFLQDVKICTKKCHISAITLFYYCNMCYTKYKGVVCPVALQLEKRAHGRQN